MEIVLPKGRSENAISSLASQILYTLHSSNKLLLPDSLFPDSLFPDSLLPDSRSSFSCSNLQLILPCKMFTCKTFLKFSLTKFSYKIFSSKILLVIFWPNFLLQDILSSRIYLWIFTITDLILTRKLLWLLLLNKIYLWTLTFLFTLSFSRHFGHLKWVHSNTNTWKINKCFQH